MRIFVIPQVADKRKDSWFSSYSDESNYVKKLSIAFVRRGEIEGLHPPQKVNINNF